MYHSLDVNFLTSDSFASCTEMDVIGNSILRFLILGSKTEKSKKKKRENVFRKKFIRGDIAEAYKYKTPKLGGHPIYRQEPTRTDKSRQEPTRAVKSRQEAFLCIF